MTIPTHTYDILGDNALLYEPLDTQLSAEIVKEMKKFKVTGVSLALVSDGDVVWTKGFGYADKISKRLAAADTIYKVGSISKVFTATAIMQLAEQGKVDIEHPIQQYIPELKVKYHAEAGRAITIRDLMTHQSGLISDRLSGMFNHNPVPFQHAIEYLNQSHAAYLPGTLSTYSNLGVDLLGILVERLSGESFEDYIKNHILSPLAMNQSTFADAQVKQELLSKAYRRYKEVEEFPLRDIPAGNLYSNVLDMSRFIKMVMDNGAAIVTGNTMKQMLSVQNAETEIDAGVNYGLNWFVSRPPLNYLGQVAWHSGGTLNFMSTMVVLPQHGLGVVVLSNSAMSNPFVEKTADTILKRAVELKKGIPVQKQAVSAEEATLPTDIAADMIGHYASILGPVEFIKVENSMRARMMGQKLRLRYHTDGWFSLHFKLLGLIPITINDLKDVRIQTKTIKDKKLLLAKEVDGIYPVGQFLTPFPIINEWEDFIGDYRIDYHEGDYAWFKKMKVLKKDGLLLLQVDMNYTGTSVLVLKPISATMAVIQGVGRGMQETVYVERNDDEKILNYSGFRAVKAN